MKPRMIGRGAPSPRGKLGALAKALVTLPHERDNFIGVNLSRCASLSITTPCDALCAPKLMSCSRPLALHIQPLSFCDLLSPDITAGLSRMPPQALLSKI